MGDRGRASCPATLSQKSQLLCSGPWCGPRAGGPRGGGWKPRLCQRLVLTRHNGPRALSRPAVPGGRPGGVPPRRGFACCCSNRPEQSREAGLECSEASQGWGRPGGQGKETRCPRFCRLHLPFPPCRRPRGGVLSTSGRAVTWLPATSRLQLPAPGMRQEQSGLCSNPGTSPSPRADGGRTRRRRLGDKVTLSRTQNVFVQISHRRCSPAGSSELPGSRASEPQTSKPQNRLLL